MPVIVDLDGPDGNAFALLGRAKVWARQLKVDFAPIQEDMMSDDYEHLLTAMEKAFPFIEILFLNDPRNWKDDNAS